MRLFGAGGRRVEGSPMLAGLILRLEAAFGFLFGQIQGGSFHYTIGTSLNVIRSGPKQNQIFSKSEKL